MAAGSIGGYASPQRHELRELLERIAQRDEAALSTLYDSTSRLVYGLIARMVPDRSAAEDITLDVYLQVWRTAGHYDASRGSVHTWLITVARSRAIDWIRANKTRLDQMRQPLDYVLDKADAAPGPEATAMDRRRANVVREALAALPEEQRQLIELAYFSGLTHSEMAERLNLPLGTVKTRVRIGMNRLRETLGPYAEGGL